MDYYKDNSNPLIKVNLMDLEPGHIYVDEQGHRFLYGEETNGQASMDLIQHSELSLGYFMEDLVYKDNRTYTKKLVGTFWSLMRNRRKQ